MSWDQLSAILDEQRKSQREERSRPPESCPNDGGKLIYNAKRGLLACEMGDYQIAAGRPREQ